MTAIVSLTSNWKHNNAVVMELWTELLVFSRISDAVYTRVTKLKWGLMVILWLQFLCSAELWEWSRVSLPVYLHGDFLAERSAWWRCQDGGCRLDFICLPGTWKTLWQQPAEKHPHFVWDWDKMNCIISSSSSNCLKMISLLKADWRRLISSLMFLSVDTLNNIYTHFPQMIKLRFSECVYMSCLLVMIQFHRVNVLDVLPGQTNLIQVSEVSDQTWEVGQNLHSSLIRWW